MGAAVPYPLAALEGLRRRTVDEARGELATAVGEAGRAASAVEEAVRALGFASERRLAAERGLAGGPAADLAEQGRWIARLRREERSIAAEVERCREESLRAAAREEQRRTMLVEAERQLRTVERHRELWEAERRRALRSAEEAELEDRTIPGAAQRST